MAVIDVTDPRFAVPDDRDSLQRLLDASRKEERRRRHVPRFVMRWMLNRAAKRSRLLRDMFGGTSAFLDGITTYVMKLGADNLPASYDNPTERRIAAMPISRCCGCGPSRLRGSSPTDLAQNSLPRRRCRCI